MLFCNTYIYCRQLDEVETGPIRQIENVFLAYKVEYTTYSQFRHAGDDGSEYESRELLMYVVLIISQRGVGVLQAIASI